jgi:general secretion pathway protein G
VLFALSLAGKQGQSLFASGSVHPRFDHEKKSRICRSREESAVTASRRHPRSRSTNSKGFTLLELLIVVAVLLTITGIAIPNLMAALDQARIARAVGDIKTFEDGIVLYQTINGQLPDDLSQVGYGNYLDPWHSPYQYLNHATMKGNGQARKDRFLVPLNSDYDLYSMGKDGQSIPPITAKVSQDDIILSKQNRNVPLLTKIEMSPF